ncbi:G-protein coupled receptor 35-like isoform X1 [Stegastes partitus]|uniref:G-protein coupled receptor 35-like isoform X1 n=2 Tax=Stegastes partitus TaxID=144197 RepID=A0A9Y4KI25_9TELE|nr:PREDICTED: G-protein coupled receptor 35-like isoform X1 [Stegastes partitus]
MACRKLHKGHFFQIKGSMLVNTTNANCGRDILTNASYGGDILTNASCHRDTLQGVGYSAVFLLGFIVNAAALWAFIARRKDWTDTHIYMLNLALADFALVLSLPFRIYDAFFCMPMSRLCTFLIATHFINMYASIMTTAAISVQRYLAIRFPWRARSWRRKKVMAFVVCLVCWILLITVATIFRKENYPENLWMCYERCKDHPLDGQFMVLLEVLGFLLPLVMIVFCSCRVICILSKDKNKTEEKKSIAGIVTANMIVFIVCYTPIHVAFIVNYYTPVPDNWKNVHLPSHKYLLTSEWIASTNCCFDSISYYFLLKQFYSGSKRAPQSFSSKSTI